MYKISNSLVLLILIFILSFSCGNKIDLTSPESVANGFCKALKKKDKDSAVKYYITLDEVKQIGISVEKFSRGIDIMISEIDQYIKAAEGCDWEKFKVTGEEYYLGHKMVTGELLFKVIDNEKRESLGFEKTKKDVSLNIGVGMININENIWKIADTEGHKFF